MVSRWLRGAALWPRSGRIMPTYTIASYGTGTITQPFGVATNIQFMNTAGIDGVVIFTRGAIGVETITSDGTTSSSA